MSDFPVLINESSCATLDENNRARALKSARVRAAETIVTCYDRLRAPFSKGRRHLDIGCGYGWFMEVAKRRGLEVEGVEPDNYVYKSVSVDLIVYHGFFPDAVPAKKYDSISFNDVLEHISDVRHVLACVSDYLSDEGLLSISIPVSDGVGFKIANILSMVGSNALLRRMWQADYPSPHIYYFSQANLISIARRCGFEPIFQHASVTVEFKTLKARVAMDAKSSLARKIIFFCGGLAYLAISKLLIADVMVFYFRKKITA